MSAIKMRSLITITVITLIVVSTVFSDDTATVNGTDDTVIVDDTHITEIADDTGDTVITLTGKREGAYRPISVDSIKSFSPSTFNRTDIFRSDGADVSEILRYRALTSVYVPFTLSNNMNRLLPYGHVTANQSHIVSSMAPEVLIDDWVRWFGGDMISGAQASELIFEPAGALTYHPYPGSIMAAPELSMYWENGVFNQNTLNLRLTRPLTDNMMISAYSNYRYFNGRRFNHERNDVVNFYRTFYRDTSLIMNRGYNPLVDEHVLGGSVMRTESDSSKFYAAFTYGNLSNEYALDIPAPTLDRLNWALLERRIYRIDAALLDKEWRQLNVDVKASFLNTSVESRFEPDTAIATWSNGENTFLSDVRLTLPSNFGFTVGSKIGNSVRSSGIKSNFNEYFFDFFYNRNFKSSYGETTLHTYLQAGREYCCHNINSDDDSRSLVVIEYHGELGVSVDFVSNGGTRLSLSTTSPAPGSHALNAECEMPWEYLGLLFGYRFTGDTGYRYMWLMDTPPYLQPQHTFIIAPWTSRYRGLSLLTRAIITDTKPNLKASAHLSYIIQPKGMMHTFETEFGFDYWSERDSIMFAGFDRWGAPIYDLNLKVAAHIGTFRLFYKMDNILNRRQAYIPGYFSPGVTFRWGVNWFI